ncbi:MAG: Asp-tRNA(Asn)/Glu-tRNA(Gln) amidotransferase subunit GatC [Azospirillaceae bacterium]
MSLDEATVARIAHLARIKLDPKDAPALAGDLSRILSFVEQLDAVDTSAVEPMTSPSPQALRWRTDQVSDGRIQDKVLANAPDRVDGFFAVPKVVE